MNAKMRLLPVLILFFVLMAQAVSYAQDYQKVMRSNVEETIGGKNYYLHRVQKGETLSLISRAYHVSVDDIRGSNVGMPDTIKPDQIIKIPVSPKKPESTVIETKEAMNYRRISAGETLYSISREYNVTIEELKAVNGGLPDGLKSGMFIKVPVREQVPSGTLVEVPQDDIRKNYFEYQAKQKESLYDIAVRYRVSIDSIYFYNSGISDQLSSGQIIKIPFGVGNVGYITHTIRQRQTVKKLARNYNISVEQIKSVNKYISRHLPEGQVVRIPLLAMDTGDGPPLDSLALIESPIVEVREKSIQETCYEKYIMGKYKVALLLPFYMSEFDSVYLNQGNAAGKSPEFIKPFVFIQFYEGFIMAMDSMKKAGLNVKLYVYNLEDDIPQTKKLLTNPELLQMDLIVGPVFSSNFKIVADFAMQHKINIVNPFSSREEVSFGNPYVFQPKPIDNDQYQVLVDYLNTYHENAQIFVARHNPYRDAMAFDELKNTLNRELKSRTGSFTDLYHEIIYSRDSIYTFKHMASVDHENVVITYSDSKVFILDMLRKLNELRDTFNITMIGMPDWTSIEGLELEDLNNLNARVLTRDFTNYSLPLVRNFVKEYRFRYATEPKEFAFSGYNIGVYFLSALMKFGPDFGDCIPYFDMELLNTGYTFESSPGNGFRNTNWKVLGLEDYHLNDVSERLDTYDLSKPPAKYFQYMDRD